MFGTTVTFGAIICLVASETVILQRIKRQDVPQEGGVIDNIFNIPITAIKQTAAAAQSFSPQNSQTIDSVLQIPISTLQAVGNLVKSTTGQRRQNAENAQKNRQERLDRLIAQRERQRLQRELLQQQRLKQQQVKRTIKVNNTDPFGFNNLSFLIGNHGILGSIVGSIQGMFGTYAHADSSHGSHGGSSHGGSSHGGSSHGSHGSQGTHGSHGSTSGNQNTYEVHENIEEDTNFTWHGNTGGTFSGSRPTSTQIVIQNKIAPKDKRPYPYKYSYDNLNRIQNKIAPTSEEDYPIENKIAPKSNKISFQS
ncbi:keratin, type I cytoskeletal 9-like [Ceratina calcarata]|uniref:Keratin, type I cytoskeletal 9-like n=1 Tax=Ceratina calcarata TaxID=156304 RepID=A0AAJ7WCB2_9HYME|nr:keratin, type I cytoskeletal 9-like [Ceratina calcarata]XP_026670210.1 keratin, type I cytoskeletal 9-like [Ceratina calcarata]